jgi:hypothetical protein
VPIGPDGPGLREPLPSLLEQVLRSAVVAHARAERRRLHPSVVHVGLPGGPRRSFEIRPEDPLDHALRTEVLQAMARDCLARDRVPLTWVTRPPTGQADADLDWAAAAGAAGGELGVRLDLVVITRRSWHDPRSEVGRTWTRIRDRRR